MTPEPGERLLRFVGDTICFALRMNSSGEAQGGQARLRTNLGRGKTRRQEIIQAHAGGAVVANASWRDLPMQPSADGWEITIPLAETGFFQAKAYWLDENNTQHWPDGPDVGICVHPDFTRSANTIYCCFTRLLGGTRSLASSINPSLEPSLAALESAGYATLPPSGKFRDVLRLLPHIVNRLGCRILHLLPIHPTPVTYARFGRFGSPYAALDLTTVDPALVEFDRKTTGIDQFCELTSAAHALGARVFLDIVINHTGWGSRLQELHPEHFLKTPAGEFASPGAWGTTWEDLVELEQKSVHLWDEMAEALMVWCRRGVDGFRCDAGYKIPAGTWQYIIARVQEEFPETVFLLEGLGGSWEATELLLTEGGMHWAYSELFQNYSGQDVAGYLDYAVRQSSRVGTYVHYSETHDNARLAERGRLWSLLRNRLCALTCFSGGFGFTSGVEWLATEKIKVHGCTGLNWDSTQNIVEELAVLNRLVCDHPCFFDGARLTRLSSKDSQVYALMRVSAEGLDSILVLCNTNLDQPATLVLAPGEGVPDPASFQHELLAQAPPDTRHETAEKQGTRFNLQPGAVHCLAMQPKPIGLAGEAYRKARAQAAFAWKLIHQNMPVETQAKLDWRWLAQKMDAQPIALCGAIIQAGLEPGNKDLIGIFESVNAGKEYPRLVVWDLQDATRVTPVPFGFQVLIQLPCPFQARLEGLGDLLHQDQVPSPPWDPVQITSIPTQNGHVAILPPTRNIGIGVLILQRPSQPQPVRARLCLLPPNPDALPKSEALPDANSLVLLTNGIGGMARLRLDLGHIESKYDCALAANLNPEVPVDRHVFLKRIRAWVNADGFLSALGSHNLVNFKAQPSPTWTFVVNAGDGRTLEIQLQAWMVQGQNTTVFSFHRPLHVGNPSQSLPSTADVRLTVRPDMEDRNFHSETTRNGGAEFHFTTHTHNLRETLPESAESAAWLANWPDDAKGCCGYAFTPAADRQLRVLAGPGVYHSQPEWSGQIPHPVEQSRGQTGFGDAYSPGWFDLPLPPGSRAHLVATAEMDPRSALPHHFGSPETAQSAPTKSKPDSFEAQLVSAAREFVVRRNSGKTVIAGYPWFLDWGRDSLICARGLLTAGLVTDVQELLLNFARFEDQGTLPNTIHGNDVSNRDTSDAPLWFAVVCEELAQSLAAQSSDPAIAKARFKVFFDTPVNSSGRTLRDVISSIARHYQKGTPNGIRMDPESGLVWSPSHFTWMDTNYPAGTPREGYPVEIQALWIRLLRLLARCDVEHEQGGWRDLARQTAGSLDELYWLEQSGWYADVLLAAPGQSARQGRPDDALRSNALLPISLGLVRGARAKRCVQAAAKHLLIPGALRSLAPLPVTLPLPIWNNQQLLNDPTHPYWPRYEGDEDTRRKPAYHNGTAWTWTFPAFCEALVLAWDGHPSAVAAARSYLSGSAALLQTGCLGQLPEILDGDAPHQQRGCDAQAWGVTEALRVWHWLKNPMPAA